MKLNTTYEYGYVVYVHTKLKIVYLRRLRNLLPYLVRRYEGTKQAR